MTEKESEVAIFDTLSNVQILSASFSASAGSPDSQALFMYAYALHANTDPGLISKEFRGKYKGLKDTEKHVLFKDMGKDHYGNAKALYYVDEALFMSKTLTRAVFYQIPDQVKFNRIRKLYNFDSVQITSTLKNIIKSAHSPEQLIADIKSVSAVLGMYESLTWWKSISHEEQNDYINQGNTLLSAIDD